MLKKTKYLMLCVFALIGFATITMGFTSMDNQEKEFMNISNYFKEKNINVYSSSDLEYYDS